MQHRRSPVASPLQAQQDDDVDHAEALSISDHRTLYLVNIFVSNTVQFLNSFNALCQDKLSLLHRKILKLDASLTLLESRLSFIEEPSRISKPVISKMDNAELASQAGQHSGVARDSE